MRVVAESVLIRILQTALPHFRCVWFLVNKSSMRTICGYINDKDLSYENVFSDLLLGAFSAFGLRCDRYNWSVAG